MRTPEQIIDDLIRARAVNNEHWGELIRLAWSAAPDKAREISKKINAQDRVVVGFAEELAANPSELPNSSTTTKRAVLIPGGGILHTYAAREALALGLTPIVTDRDPNCPCAKIPEVEFHEEDCYDVDGTLEMLGFLEGDEPSSDLVGAFCGGADTHVVVAAVNEAMGLTGRWVSRKAAETCKDKAAAKIALLQADVPTAKFDHETNVGGYICKPRRSSGSRGVMRCPRGQRCDCDVRHGRVGDTLHEELLEGLEQSVEILLREVGYIGINVVDRHFAWVDDQPLEWGHTNPTRLSDERESTLYDLAYKAAKAVGADVGFFKIDSIWTKDGPKVLECTPRLSGGYDSQISTPMSSGRNLLRFGLQIACGLPLEWKLIQRQRRETVTVIHRPELAGAANQKT